MKPKKHPLFSIYQWIVAYPLIAVATILVATATVILSPVFPNNKLSYNPARWWGRIICRLCFVPVKVHGLDKLDSQQSYIFALNHQSFFDVFVVYSQLPFIFKWMMKAELRNIPFVGKACVSAGHIFIDRTNPATILKSMEKAKLQLRDGVSLVIFPEGTRTYSGELGKFKRGAFQLATQLSLPIVPVTLRGSFERMPRNSVNVTRGPIEMFIHEPVDPHLYRPDQFHELIQFTRDQIQSAL